ncbi:MAG: hypothetical protein ACM31O_14100 [Bacteroidota bacterium]
MASALYPKFKELLLGGDIDLMADTIKAALVDSNDVSFNTAHDFLDDVSAGIVGTPQTLNNKSITNGVFDADDITFPSVTGDQVEVILLYKDTGNPATSPLIAWIDTAASGLPVTPNGGNINVAWSSGANKIFSL